MRQILFFSVLLAAMCSGPLAAGAVLVEWARLDHRALFDPLSPALWSARTFLAYFDVFVLVSLVPCAACVSLAVARLRAKN